MRRSMLAQSHDSVPPAPALMEKMQLLWSCGPSSINSSSSASSRPVNLGKSAANSDWMSFCVASSSPSASSIIVLMSACCVSALSNGSMRRLIDDDSATSFWA